MCLKTNCRSYKAPALCWSSLSSCSCVEARWSVSLHPSPGLRISRSHQSFMRLLRQFTTTARPVSNELRTTLELVRERFPNRHNLHERIDVALDQSDKARIAIIPWKTHRTKIKNLLDAVLADPLASDQAWFTALKTRLLSKDALVKYSPQFSYVETSNSLAEYPIPFNIPSSAAQPDPEKYEFIEINSWEDSKKHVLSAQLHVFVSRENPQAALTSKLPSAFPSVIVVDDETLAGANLGNNVIALSSDLAVHANEVLEESPANASQFTTLMARSNISALETRMLQPADALRLEVIKGIIKTCEQSITPDDKDNFGSLQVLTEQESANIEKLRKQWAKDAHTELQRDLTTSVDDLLYHKLAWWKIYYKVDDVYDHSAACIQHSFLPHAKASLDYLVGRIDSFADKNYLLGTEELKHPMSDEISVSSVSELLNNEAPQLHNSALRALSVTIFGIQLPSLVVPLLGWYFFHYSFFSMGSIMALGTVIGFRHLQKSWLKAGSQFRHKVLERARKALNKCEADIWKRWESKVISQQDKVKGRLELAQRLKKEVEKFVTK